MALGALLLLFFSLAEPSAGRASNTIFGVWATEKNHGRVLIEPCGGNVCARVLDGDQLRANPNQADVLNPDPAKRNRLVRGMYILQGYSGGPTHWQGGTVYDPQTGDQSSDSTLDLVGDDELKIEGCKFVLCRTETWTRDKSQRFGSGALLKLNG